MLSVTKKSWYAFFVTLSIFAAKVLVSRKMCRNEFFTVTVSVTKKNVFRDIKPYHKNQWAETKYSRITPVQKRSTKDSQIQFCKSTKY